MGIYMDPGQHGLWLGLWRRPNLENELYSISQFCPYSEPGSLCSLTVCWGKSLQELQNAHTTLLALLDGLLLSLPQPVTAATSLVCSLHSFPHLHRIFVHQSGIANCRVLHSIFFCTNSFTCKYSWQRGIGLVQGFRFLKYHKSQVVFETRLG